MTIKTFNPVAAWDVLTPQAQRTIGATFLAYEMAVQAANQGGPERTPPIAFAEVTETALYPELRDLIEHNFRTAFENDETPLPPDLNALGIRQCTECGCTDNHACPEGCNWAGDTICSRCAS